jgi:hypothetical protein
LGRQGVISQRFFSNGGSFVPANMILSKVDPEYDGSIRFKQARYKLLTSIGMLKALRLLPPFGYDVRYPSMPAHEFFIGYLVFDALVGNTDRHHENWGVVVNNEGVSATFRLGPSFDHASSLGRDLTDERRRARLLTNDSRFSVEGYSERARSAFYGLGQKARALTTREMVAILAESFADPVKLWGDKIANVSNGLFQDILGQVPSDLMSNESKEFALRMIVYNQRMIREVALGC